MMRQWIRRLPRWARISGIAAIAVGLPIAWYLGSPLFIDVHVDEALPPATSSTSLPPSAGSATAPTATSTNPTPTAEVNATARPPQTIASGSFTAIDAIHRGEGQALILRLADGRHVVRFESFRVGNGPDLFVYVSGHPAPRSSKQLHEGAALNLGRLKGNVGNQNYTLPADADLAQFKSVVIYCKQFSTVFSTATLSAP